MKTLEDPQFQKILSHGMKMLGDAWTLLIIEQLRQKEKRFSEIEKSILDINPATLSNRLKKMEQCRLIERNQEESKLSVNYKLTEKGKELLPIIEAIESFIKKHVNLDECNKSCKK